MKVLSDLDIKGHVKLETSKTLILKTSQNDGVYLGAGETNGEVSVIFTTLDNNDDVRIEGVANPTNGTDAANKGYVDGLLNNNNAVYLNGYSDSYGIQPWSLCAFAFNTGAIMTMTSFTTSSGMNGKPPIEGKVFPIGCKIYYHPDEQLFSATTNFVSKKFYSTYKEVNARYSAVTGTSVSLGSSSSSSVYLRVSIENGYWKPFVKSGQTTEIIVSSNNLVNKNFYIYLGKTVGSTGYTFQLEDNNPLYYYDGLSLIDWASYQASEAAPSYTAGDGIDITNNVISCTPRPYKKEVFTDALFNANSVYEKSWQNFIASSNLEVGTYKVTLQVHLYIVSNMDYTMPSGCVVNVYMRNKITASSRYHYILGTTETFVGSELPETEVPNGRGIISKVLNVVGFMEVTGEEDGGCSLEVKFTTNSSLNVQIGNPTPLDGSCAGLCSGNDFVLLEKIA